MKGVEQLLCLNLDCVLTATLTLKQAQQHILHNKQQCTVTQNNRGHSFVTKKGQLGGLQIPHAVSQQKEHAELPECKITLLLCRASGGLNRCFKSRRNTPVCGTS